MNTILTDDERRELRSEHGWALDTIKIIEAAVLAKLREQEPVAWRFRLATDSGWSNWRTDPNDLGRFKREGYKIEYAYAAPLPAVVQVPPIPLNIIRKWPDGFEARLQHVWKDVISFIPNVKLWDLQRVLAEFGFRMEVYEQTSAPKGRAE